MKGEKRISFNDSELSDLDGALVSRIETVKDVLIRQKLTGGSVEGLRQLLDRLHLLRSKLQQCSIDPVSLTNEEVSR